MKTRRWVGAASVVAATVAGVLVVQGATGQPVEGRTVDSAKPGPVKSAQRTAPLKVSGGSAVLGKQDAKRFSMLGVTWADPSARVTGTVEARTRGAGTGTWSPWLELDSSTVAPGDESGARGGTEPAWVGPSDGVEVRVQGRSTGLPRGLQLHMIDPGSGKVSAMEPAAFAADATPVPAATETGGAPAPEPPAQSPPASGPAPTETATPTTAPATTPAPSSPPVSVSPKPPESVEPSTVGPSPSTSAPTPTPTPSAPASTAPKPPITDRAGWGADESISPEAPGYLPGGRIKAAVVHHTTGSNSYTCAEAPALVRGIYAYHVTGLKWKDIGYNFLVDKCGVVYEGRKGGVDQPVMGAHNYGFNSETTGISVLGSHDLVAPSRAALTSVARVAAWKLGQYGVSPTGTATMIPGADGKNLRNETWKKGVPLDRPAIFAHRDSDVTVCPGDFLYSQMPAIREMAGGKVDGLAVTSVAGAGLAGSTYYTKGTVTVNWSATTPAALVSGYELLVDGRVAATTAGTATSARATLTPGSHKVQIRGLHQSGNRSGLSSPVTVVAETTAPAFPTKPGLTLRKATVDTRAVPLTLGWKAGDNSALKEVRLTAPVARTYGPTVTGASHTAASGVATKWSLTAHDQAGNTGSASVSGTPVILQESSATKSGAWSTKSSTSYLGGKSYSSSSKNAALTWTFTGRSAALVVSRATTSGQAHIYVDGKKTDTVDLKSASTKYRDALWTKSWSTSAKHTVKIVVVGTKGRPAITTDGLVYLK
ncbi:peptidoglycan recognition protein [Streptomyces sp. NPDC001985]|uniref:peptidoglycan recognition protein family protein n=1 Tax=Streptomyces sp. NPDC001985 TaxID=3154406 RepID=UPI00332D13D9